MSQQTAQPTLVHCPKCGETQAAHAVTSIPADSDLVQDLFRGTLNQVACEECGATFLLDTPLTFRDDDDACIIYCMPVSEKGAVDEAEASMRELTQAVFGAQDSDPVPSCRLTVSRRQFIEKIALHMHGFDDRLVEYVKYQLLNRPDSQIDPIRSQLFYDFSNSNGSVLAFIVFDRESGKPSAAAHIPRDIYDELVETFASDPGMQEELDQLFPGYYVSVDRLA